MNIDILKDLLNIDRRHQLFNKIIVNFKSFEEIENFNIKLLKISEGTIPIITISDSSKIESTRYVKVFIGAQHNEYNGLFGIIEFLRLIQERIIPIDNLFLNKQDLIFFPLMNPYGFINPTKENKSGYFLQNGTNLNRYWRRTFAPEYIDNSEEQNEYPLPEHTNVVRSVLEKYWNNKDINIYIMDFHETSLLERHLVDLSQHLNIDSITYKFDHWLKEKIILNILDLYNISYHQKDLFIKCNRSINHNHIQLSIKQIEIIYEKLLQYIKENEVKLPFYFCYGNKSEVYCKALANNVYSKLKATLWLTHFPAYSHFHDHGCFVKMGDCTIRPKVYAMELETHKQFFNIYEEIEKSKSNLNYFEKKLRSINISIDLVVETIKEMINLF